MRYTRTLFFLTLSLSVAGNVYASWGDVPMVVLGFVLPFLLLLAEGAIRENTKGGWVVIVLFAASALSIVVLSFMHLASLGKGGGSSWQDWLIPVAVDLLLILSALGLLRDAQSQDRPETVVPEVQDETIVPETAPVPETVVPKDRPRKPRTSRASRDPREDATLLLLEIGDDSSVPPVTALKTRLSCGYAHAKSVRDEAIRLRDAVPAQS